MEKGILYIVSTPIGNLEDITLRALRILKEVQLIAAEDTRRTKKLLNAYDINTPLTSLYDHNESRKSPSLIAKLNEGINIAYVSDAGTPGISDPGYTLIRRAIEDSIRIISVPGPSAVLASLSSSGLPMNSFVFYGFMPTRTVKRRQFLESLANETKTMVFYESPKRLKASLGDIEEILGDREIVVSRELTKIHEEILRGNISGIARSLDKKEIKGEITLVVSGGEETAIEWSSEHIRERFAKLREKYRNLSAKDIVGMVSEETKMPKKKIYAQMLEFMEEDAVKDTPICKSQHGKGNL